MNKLLILFIFLSSFGLASTVRANCYSNCFYGVGYYGSSLAWNESTGIWAVNQAVGVIQDVWTAVEQGKALEAELQARRNNLENYKSVQRYYTEGIPAFSPVSPEGKPRSPKITWKDVESIR
ncbi:MAG TPA: hypothetical protein DF383_11090 [Deltaproteobacteria bacterium]|nr:hypothetical protein [Deltaproteobacteria bacterium]